MKTGLVEGLKITWNPLVSPPEITSCYLKSSGSGFSVKMQGTFFWWDFFRTEKGAIFHFFFSCRNHILFTLAPMSTNETIFLVWRTPGVLILMRCMKLLLYFFEADILLSILGWQSFLLAPCLTLAFFASSFLQESRKKQHLK